MEGLKNLVLDNVLTANEMKLVKGGVNAAASMRGLAMANSATSDDKRRERPGGGITTL